MTAAGASFKRRTYIRSQPRSRARLRHVVVKRAQSGGAERGPAARRSGGRETASSCSSASRRSRLSRDALEAHVELLFERAETAADVGAMRCAERREIRIPCVAGERNVGTGAACGRRSSSSRGVSSRSASCSASGDGREMRRDEARCSATGRSVRSRRALSASQPRRMITSR